MLSAMPPAPLQPPTGPLSALTRDGPSSALTRDHVMIFIKFPQQRRSPREIFLKVGINFQEVSEAMDPMSTGQHRL